MTTITIPNNWKPRDYQMPLWNYLENGGKRAIVIAHRRWGKDDVMLHNAASQALQKPGTYWHCLPEYAQARKAIWNSVNLHTSKRRIDEAFPHEIRKRTNDQEMFIELINGSTWQVIGSDRYDSLVGAGVAGVTFSEWALCNPSAWGYISPMMRENKGWAMFITTPRGRNHAYDMFKMAEKNEIWHAEYSNVAQTKAFTPEELEEILQTDYISIFGHDIGLAQFQQEYECSFNAAILGAFYAREMTNVRSEGRITDECVADPELPVHTSWDIGVRDDTSIWFFQVVGTQVFILDCYSTNGAGVDHYASFIEDKFISNGWQKGVDFVPHDARVKEWGTGRTRVETMISLGLNPQVVPQSSLLDGINAVRRTLPSAVFHPNCESGIAALEQYRREWDDNKKTFKASPLHDWSSHFADSFRYLAMSWQLTKPAPKPIIEPVAPSPYHFQIKPPTRGRRSEF